MNKTLYSFLFISLLVLVALVLKMAQINPFQAVGILQISLR